MAGLIDRNAMGGGAAAVVGKSGAGKDILVPVVAVIGSADAQTSYGLASGQSIAANDGTSPVMKLVGGSYIFDAQFTGTSIKLQALGADGSTWRDVATLNAPGAIGVVLGTLATVRLFNSNGTGLTGVSASLT